MPDYTDSDVEKAARALVDSPDPVRSWASMDDDQHDLWRTDARAVLDAVAPDIARAAKVEALREHRCDLGAALSQVRVVEDPDFTLPWVDAPSAERVASEPDVSLSKGHSDTEARRAVVEVLAAHRIDQGSGCTCGSALVMAGSFVPAGIQVGQWRHAEHVAAALKEAGLVRG